MRDTPKKGKISARKGYPIASAEYKCFRMDIILLFELFLLLFAFTYLPLGLTASPNSNQNWDLNWPCQAYITRLAEAEAKFVRCAVGKSSPPRVCTNCFNQYIELKQLEYLVHHLENVSSVDGTPCSTVIYGNYLLSYASEVSHSLTKNIWGDSKCKFCLNISWDFQHQNSTAEFNNQTRLFNTYLQDWRSCVEATSQNDTKICTECDKNFDKFFDYYWKIYIDPEVDFCIDAESVMNDTMNMWHNVWKCTDDPRNLDRRHDILVVGISSTLLAIVIGLFYAGSYIQTENAQRNLIQYSNLQSREPRGPRSRILSSSNLDSYAAYSSSSHSSGS